MDFSICGSFWFTAANWPLDAISEWSNPNITSDSLCVLGSQINKEQHVCLLSLQHHRQCSSIVSSFWCWVTHYHNSRCFKTTRIILSHYFWRLHVQTQPNWALCSGSHKPHSSGLSQSCSVIWRSTGADLPDLPSCWQVALYWIVGLWLLAAH